MARGPRPRTFEDLLKVYDAIYRAEDVEHPTKGDIGKYGDAANRHKIVMNFMEETIGTDSHEVRVLDSSCGRGNLLRLLLAEGYRAEGTEIVPYLLMKELQNLPVRVLGYHQLRELGESAFDVVISCDVLEHLLNVAQVRNALENLWFVSRKWLLITVGIYHAGAQNWPQSLPQLRGLVTDLHLVRQRKDWWRDLIQSFIDVKFKYQNKRELYMFGTKKETLP